MRKFILSLGFMALCSISFGQQAIDCGSTEALKQVLSNPEIKANYLADREQLEKSLETFVPKKVDNGIIVPCVFHVIHGGGAENITDDQIIECVNQMTEDYNGADSYDFDPDDTWTTDAIPEFADIKANIGISFALAKKDPDGNSTSGIIHHEDSPNTVQSNGGEAGMKNKYKWPNNKYMNVYVIRSAGGEAGSAWAYYPGIGSTFDGVTTSFWAVGRTRLATPTHYKIMTHEVGHWADLPHTFDGGCGGGDGVADTPPCTTGGGCNIYDSPCGVLANRQNYMDYGNCTIMFTEGQKTKMLNAMNGSASGRNNLWTEANLIATGVIGEKVSAAFYSYQLMTVPGDTITYHDVSETETGDIVKWEWEFPGGIPASSIGQTPPPIIYKAEGKYSAKLTVTHADGETDFEYKENYVSVQRDIYMQNASFEVDQATLYDPGLKGRYGNRTDATVVLRPITQGRSLQAEFISLKMETDCATDYLEIYDGPSTASPKLGKYCASTNPGTIISSHASGALTFVFHANVRNRFDGFEAEITEIDIDPTFPEAKFKADLSSACVGGTVNFTNKSTGIPDTYEWTFEGGTPATSTEENPTIVYDSKGQFKVSLKVKNSFGEDTEEKNSFVEIGIGKVYPFMEGFEGDFPPHGWVINNPDNGLQWEKRADLGSISSSSMIMNNADNAKKGEIDEVTMVPMNLEGHQWESQLALKFDVAYTKYDANSPDKLSVLVSVDCGATWDEVYNKAPDELQTVEIATAQSNAWTPSKESDWRMERIDLQPFLGNEYVLIKFQNESGYGTRVWIDNINIEGVIGVGELERLGFSVFPNPSSGLFTLNSNLKDSKGTYQIMDLNGKTIQSGSINRDETSLDLSGAAKGIYLLKLTGKYGSYTERLIVK